MLIRFSVENHKSFSKRAELSMVPGKSRQHPHQIHSNKSGNGLSLLKSAFIYGANASGKTNLVHAIYQAQMMVVYGATKKTIPYSPNKLSVLYSHKPTRLEFEIQINDVQYAYGFEFDAQNIMEEWLFRVEEKEDILVFERKFEGDYSQFKWGELGLESEEDKQFLAFTAKGTPQPRLFLTECSERNIFKHLQYLTDLSLVFDWFTTTLRVIFPDSTPINLKSEGDSEQSYQRLLQQFDTGISNLGFENVSFVEGSMHFDIKKFSEELSKDERIELRTPEGNLFSIELDSEGIPELSQLITQHKNDQGEDIPFKLNEESDGTQRLLDLAPALMSLFNSEKVFVIDEFNRSLHPDITHSILSAFLSKEAAHRSQLIFTTHQTTLLDQNLVRRDEIWFAQKDTHGSSKLYSLEEYKPRADKDIRGAYLDGRYGGVPILPDLTNLNWLCDDA